MSRSGQGAGRPPLAIIARAAAGWRGRGRAERPGRGKSPELTIMGLAAAG